jgi:hypothetical protein
VKVEFECTGCGRCCKSPPKAAGDRGPRLAPQDVERLAGLLGPAGFLGFVEVSKEEGRLVSHLQLKPLEGGWRSCIFLDNENKCAVYEHRPDMCRAFPFMETLWRKPGRWQAANCEGLKVTNDA